MGSETDFALQQINKETMKAIDSSEEDIQGPEKK